MSSASGPGCPGWFFFIFYKVHKTCPGFQKTALQQNIDGQTIEDEDEK